MKRFSKLAACLSMMALPLCGEDTNSPSMVLLDTYVVTGTKTENTLMEVPIKTELYDASTFDDFNFTSLREAIKLVPTARFESDCQNCGLNQVQLLGLSTEYTAILFDSAPMYSSLAKVYGADLFPAIFIDRMEVVKGGGSVLYGPEAIAGVVNLIPAEPVETDGKIEVSFGSLKGDAEEYEVTGRYDYVDADGEYAFILYGLHQDIEGLDLGSDGFTEIPEFENTVLGTQWWLHPSDRSTLKFNYQYLDEAHRGGDNLNLPVEEARVSEALEHEIHLAQISFDTDLSEDTHLLLKGSYMYAKRNSFYGARGDSEQAVWEAAGNAAGTTPTSAFIAARANDITDQARRIHGVSDNWVYFVEGQLGHSMDDHYITAGVQYRYELFEDATPNNPDTPKTDDDFSNLGVYIQDEWSINEKFELVPSARIDDHENIDDAIISPRISARYLYSDDLTLRASFSTGFNAPGAFNEDQHIGTNQSGAITLRNATGLKEESSRTYSAGFDYLPPSMDGQLIYSSTVYFTHLKDTFDIDDSNPTDWLRINGQDADIFVWEHSIDWRFDKHWRASGGVSYVKARFDNPVARVTGLTTDEFLERPEWTGFLGINYENHDLFNAYLLADYTGTMLATGEDADIFRETPTFWDVNVGISKGFQVLGDGTELVLSAGIDNLFDDRQDDFQETGEDRDVTYFYGPARPRTFQVSAAIEF